MLPIERRPPYQVPKGGERIYHRRRRKKILGDELIRNELS